MFTTTYDKEEGWQRTVQPNVLRKVFDGQKGMGRSKQIAFIVKEDGEGGVRVGLMWEWMGDTRDTGSEEQKRLRGEGVYAWKEGGLKISDDGEGEIVRRLEDVVEEAGRWEHDQPH